MGSIRVAGVMNVPGAECETKPGAVLKLNLAEPFSPQFPIRFFRPCPSTSLSPLRRLTGKL